MMKKTIILIMFVLDLFSAQAQQKFTMDYEGRMYTNITVSDEKGIEHEVRALISTGVNCCFMDSALYRSLYSHSEGRVETVNGGFGHISTAQWCNIDSLIFDNRVYRNIEVLTIPFIDQKEPKIVIGSDILDGQIWRINMQDSTITRIEKVDKKHKETIRCQRNKKNPYESHILYIPLDIQGKLFYCYFSTAHEGVTITEDIPKQNWTREVKEGEDKGIFHYNARHQKRLPQAKIRPLYSQWKIIEPVIYIPTLGYNSVGNVLFQGHSYIVDYKKNKIYIY